MFYLRIALILIIGLGCLVYLISTKIRSEYLNMGGTPFPLFRGQNAEFKAFCRNPPTEYVSRLLKLKKNLSIALIIIAVVTFSLVLVSVTL